MRKLRSSSHQTDAKSVLIAGGVAANLRFRQMLTSSLKRILSRLTYCSDNGAMIAALGYYLYESEDDRVVSIIPSGSPIQDMILNRISLIMGCEDE